MKRRRLLFRHEFTTGERARCSIRGLKNPPQITWDTGTPGKHVLPEYRAWMESVMQTAATHFGGSIVYSDGSAAVLFIPHEKRATAGGHA